jgi:hypothetical protein
MRYQELIGTVSTRSGIPAERAEKAARATLQPLAERLRPSSPMPHASAIPDPRDRRPGAGTPGRRTPALVTSGRHCDRPISPAWNYWIATQTSVSIIDTEAFETKSESRA